MNAKRTGGVRRWLSDPRVRRWAQIVITLLILVFFGLALYDLAPKVAAYEWRLEWGWLLLALVLLMARGPLPVWGWWLIMQRLGYPLPFRKSTRMVYYSALAGFLPGSMWHAVSRVYLAEQVGIPKLITTISVVVESALNLLAAVAVAGLSLLAWPDPPLWAVIPAALGLVTAVLRPDLFFRLVDWTLARLGRKPLGVRLSPGDVVRITVPFALNWLAFGAIFYALLASLYPTLSLLYLPVVTGIFTVAWVGGYLAIVVPQGLGVREFIIVTLLAVLGIPAPVATAAALLARLWSLLGIGIWGAISTKL
ncbi:MAG: lysylphosphatidylglycerol synthase domain-containing protein [Chloroflexia bacterium]